MCRHPIEFAKLVQSGFAARVGGDNFCARIGSQELYHVRADEPCRSGHENTPGPFNWR
jgi:hypothetical protein